MSADETKKEGTVSVKSYGRSRVKKAMAASFMGVQDSNRILKDDDDFNSMGLYGGIPPPYDLQALTELVDRSAHIEPCIDAYRTNIDGFGHRFEAVINLDNEHADSMIANAIYANRVRDAERKGLNPDEVEFPSAVDVAAQRKRIELQMIVERNKLETFFGSCCLESSFVELRKKTRTDIESTGNGYWEVLRNQFGEITQLAHVHGDSVFLGRTCPEFVNTTIRVRTSAVSVENVPARRRFRYYVQESDTGSSYVYYKEFGDPRVMSRDTGTYYTSLEDMYEQAPNDVPATELLHFKLNSATSVYGVPRWIGATPSVTGARASDELNNSYFDNSSVPPLAVLVEGGRLTKETADRLDSFFESEGRGTDNFGRVLIVEALATPTPGSPDNNGKVTVSFKPLMEAQQNDAHFQKYDERCGDKIGMMFRLPRIIRGDMRDFNQGTAQSAIAVTESQVFSPLREEFDLVMDKFLLMSMGIVYYTFRSNAPTKRDPDVLAEQITKLARVGVLTPNDGRSLAEGVFNVRLPYISADWTKQPLQLSQVGVPVEGGNLLTGQVTGQTLSSSGEERRAPQIQLVIPQG